MWCYYIFGDVLYTFFCKNLNNNWQSKCFALGKQGKGSPSQFFRPVIIIQGILIVWSKYRDTVATPKQYMYYTKQDCLLGMIDKIRSSWAMAGHQRFSQQCVVAILGKYYGMMVCY